MKILLNPPLIIISACMFISHLVFAGDVIYTQPGSFFDNQAAHAPGIALKYYRYMSFDEFEQVIYFEKLRGSRAGSGNTFFTPDFFHEAQMAQSKLALGEVPDLWMQFEIDASKINSGFKSSVVSSLNGQLGGGFELFCEDEVAVKITDYGFYANPPTNNFYNKFDKLVSKTEGKVRLQPKVREEFLKSDIGLEQFIRLQREKSINKFQPSKLTWTCHWFPLLETNYFPYPQKKPGGDPNNNLYAIDGALDKLDKITGASAREYEWKHNRVARISEGHEAYLGHNRQATLVSALLRKPKREVNYKDITFTVNDIQGLLVKVVEGFDIEVDRPEASDITPEVFLSTLIKWSKDGLPFVLDIGDDEKNWEFPFDHIEMSESRDAPKYLATKSLPEERETFYHIEISSRGFEAHKRVYDFVIRRDSLDNVLTSEWLKAPTEVWNGPGGTTECDRPRSMWRPRPKNDLTKIESWDFMVLGNPNVDPKVVYEIYSKSR